MTVLFIYLLKAGVCLAAFYMVYLLLFGRLTFFAFNRFYLVAGIALSFAIPLIEIELPALPPEPAAFILRVETAVVTEDMTVTTLNHIYKEKPFDYLLLAGTVYFAGVAALLFRLLSSFVRIWRIRRRSHAVGRGHFTVPEGVPPFSFFNAIFVPHFDDRLIVEHEKVHIRQCHWADMLFMEAATLLLWFNPFVFLYRYALRSQHEYLADSGITGSGESIPEYLECLLRQVQRVCAGSPAINFFGKTIKKRVIMITRSKTPRKYALLYLLVLPVAVVLAVTFASRTYAQAIQHAGGGITDTPDVLDSQIPSGMPIESKLIKMIIGNGNFTVVDSTGKAAATAINVVINHSGAYDITAPEGTQVTATADGTVTKSAYDEIRGNYVRIEHRSGYSTLYTHLRERSVNDGDRVTKGQVIGIIGNTGLSTGLHVHYEALRNGERIPEGEYMEMSQSK